MLTHVMAKDKALMAQYRSFIKSQASLKGHEKCKAEQLKSSVSENLCFQKAGVDGQNVSSAKQAKAVKSCVRPFNIDACMGVKN
jgi:hypothetical protein